MEAVILSSGIAVKKANLVSPVFNIYGVLSEFFDLQNKKVIYLNISNFLEESIQKAIPGYYYLEQYNLYMINPKEFTIEKLIKEHKFVDFINAEVNDSIRVDVISLEPPFTSFYSYNEYNFTHVEVGRNYLLDLNSERLNPAYLGTGVPRIFQASVVSSGFFTKQMSIFDSVITEEKSSYFEYVVKSALRIGMIESTIFPLLLSPITQTGSSIDVDLSLVHTLKNSLCDKWQNTVILNENSSHLYRDVFEYYNFLTNFYINCFSNQKYILKSNATVRLQYFVNVLSVDLLYLINPFYKIKLLKMFCLGFSDKTVKLSPLELSKAIVKISDSFDESQPDYIDAFLDYLISDTNEVSIEIESHMESLQERTRSKITLFEFVYRTLQKNIVQEIWEHSPLYYKINSSFNLDNKVSALSSFITKIYSLWIKSKYNPYRNNEFNEDYIGYPPTNNQDKTFTYTRESAFTFNFPASENEHITETINRSKAPIVININEYNIYAMGGTRDTMSSQFVDFDKILISTTDINNVNINGVLNPDFVLGINLARPSLPYGYYNFYQAVQVVNLKDREYNTYQIPKHSWDENGEQVSQSYIPAFLFHFMDEKKEIDFLYNLFWVNVQAAYKALPESSKIVKFFEVANSIINETLEIVETVVPENVYQFINDYSVSCNLNNDFCKKINVLSFWISDYVTNKNRVIITAIYNAAQDLVIYADANGWPNEFNSGIGLDAKNKIYELAGHDSLNIEDRKRDILLAVKNRISKEEPTGNTTKYQGFSLNKWTYSSIDKLYHKTNERHITDESMLEIIEEGINLKVLDHWVEGILTKAFRISKVKSRIEVEAELLNASNLLKPLPSPGRSNLLYCFHSTSQQSVFEDLVKEHYIDKYEINDILSENGQLKNTYYGGSIHTKILPPDIDMVSYISSDKMVGLYNKQIEVLKNAENRVNVLDNDEISARINNLKNSYSKNKGRVTSNNIYTIVGSSLHKMSNEYKRMIVQINGSSINILDSRFLPNSNETDPTRLNLDPTKPLDKRFDFVFFTKQDALNGRSIPPETKVDFNN